MYIWFNNKKCGIAKNPKECILQARKEGIKKGNICVSKIYTTKNFEGKSVLPTIECNDWLDMSKPQTSEEMLKKWG